MLFVTFIGLFLIALTIKVVRVTKEKLNIRG